MKKIITLLFAFSLSLTLFSACGTTKAPPENSETPETVTFTDSTGRAVELPKTINKIAVSGPLAQIVLFALAPDKLVGIAGDWDATAEAYLDEKYYSLPIIGHLYGTRGELNLEELLAAQPDIVIDVGEAKDTIAEDMAALQEQTGIPFVHISATTDKMGEAYRALGKLLSMEAEAESLAAYCDDTYSLILSLVDAVGEENKASLIYCLGDVGLNVIAKSSYHAEILDLLTDNAAVVSDPSSKGLGNEVSMEQLLNWNPDVIVFAPNSVYDTVEGDETWQQLSAISSGSYYEVPLGPYNWMGFPPSVQRYPGMLWLGKLLYPQQADYDLYEKVSEYYKLFYHCDLTQAQYDELMVGAL